MSRIISCFLTLLLLLTSVPVLAQEAVSISPEIDTEILTSGSPLNCFEHYTFGSVQADLQSSLAQTVPGATLTFQGQVVNNNPYPLVGGTLYVRIFKRDEATFAESDGNPVVDQFVVATNISIPPNGSKETSFEWLVPNNAEGGEYYAAYFFTTAERYNLLGLSFTDDIVGNQAQFSITSDNLPVAKLSKIDTTLNGQDHRFAAFPLSFEKDEAVMITTSITNPTDTKKTMPLQWNQYAWDAMSPDNRRFTKTELITLEPNETKELVYEVQSQREPVVYVTVTTQDLEVKSFLNIRYVRDGIEETRINFPSITKFPLEEGVAQTLFACAHSTNIPQVEDNTLTLTLTDDAGNQIHQYKYHGVISDAMSGFGDVFTPTRNYNYILLTATLERGGVIVEEVQVAYDCQVIDPNSCLLEPVIKTNILFDKLMNNPLVSFLAIALLLTLLLILFVQRRHKIGPHITTPENDMTTLLSLLFFLLLLPALFFAPGMQEVEAKSVTFSHQVAQYVSPCTQTPCLGQMYIYTANMTYVLDAYYSGTQIKIPENSTVSVGTVIDFRQNFLAEHNSWYHTGASLDTPYGVWVSNINSFTPSTGQELGVQYPNVTYNRSASTANLTCVAEGATCTVDTPGTIVTNAVYSAAPYRFGGSHSIYSPAVSGSGNFPVQQIPYVLNAVAGNAPPNTPTISGPTESGTNANETFTFNANDPDGDTIRYGIDWDNNGSVDTWVPGGDEYVTSGTSETGSHSWPSTGSYTFQVLTQDSNGASSGWANHTITISNNCVVPTGAITPYGTEAEIIDSCAFTAQTVFGGGLQFTRPTDFTSAYVIYQDSWTDFLGAQTGERLQVCHNSSNVFLMTTNCSTGGGIAGVFTPQAQCTPPTRQCDFNTAPTATLTVNGSAGPLDVARGAPLTIAWSSTNATNCTAYWLTGAPNVGPSGIDAENASISNNYVISCNGATASVQVNVINQAPNPPNITYTSGATETNQDVTFSIQGTDPDNDQIYYEIDRDNDGVVDIATPGAGFVPSDTTRPFTRSWATTGDQTFQARTVDSANARSVWTTHTINITAGPPPPPPPTAELDVQVNSDPWINNPNEVTIEVGDTVRIGWESTGADSCSATAGTGFVASGTSGSDEVTPPPSNTSENFSASCTGPGGTVSDTVRIITNLAQPNLYPARATVNPGAINPATGNYQTVDLIFDIANDGNAVVTQNFDYQLDIDYGRDGTFALNEANGTITDNITANDTNGVRTTATLNDFPFGNFTLRVIADTPLNGVVSESNEGDNTETFNLSLPPADPGLSLEADRIQVRSGDTVTLTWTATLNYPMNCTVTGPAGVSVDPATFPGSVTTGPISSKSEFILSCVEPITNTSFTDRVTVETVGEVEEI